MSYLLDTDVFIGAKNLHYGFEFCPAFWDWLVAANASGVVFSTEKVYDELSDWARGRDRKFFLPPDESILSALREVSDWVASQNYTFSAVTIFCKVQIIILSPKLWLRSIRLLHMKCLRPLFAESRFQMCV